MFNAVSPDEIRAAQMLTGGTMALFLMAGLVPGLRPYAGKIRAGVLAAYLLGCAAFVGYVLIK
ncbi:MAG TPA: hypothetical protein VMU81_04830 [Acetobacteraceae bacterium]|jgi:hypothetical protein|nr:hypothetical protein [Acetobacteraceae bacterium]